MNQRDQKTKRFIMNDLTGQRFGKLTVLEPLAERYKGKVMWRCRCDCGNIVTRNSYQLKAGVRTSCGCERTAKIRNDLTGQHFGMLTVIRPTDQRMHRSVVWECLCDCGCTELVPTQYLKDGSVTNCRLCRQDNRPKRDITGQRFGSLTAMYPTTRRDRDQSVIWHCRCDCGNEVEHSCAELQRGSYISCGCRKRAAEEQLQKRVTHIAGTTVELLRQKKVRSDSTTGITGVNEYRGKYKAVICFQGKVYSLGTYQDPEEAAAVRKEAEECLFGEFLEFYDRWKQKADEDPAWGAENPVSVDVRKDENGHFRVAMLPTLE